MKKIVALVLSLVMALSLCTVAFGATTYDVTEKQNNGKAVATVKAVDATKDTLAHYKDVKDSGKLYVVTEDADEYTHAMIVDGKVVKLIAVTADQLKAMKVTAVKEHKYVGCGDNNDKAPAKCYKDEDGKYYVVDKDKTKNTIALTEDGKFDNVFKARLATVFGKANDYDVSSEVIEAGHLMVLVKANIEYKTAATGNKVVKNVNEYKCAFCGRTFYGSDYQYSTPETAKVMDYEYAVKLVEKKLVKLDDGVVLGNVKYYWSTDVDSSNTTNGNVNSAKTFDAGIAMYVGMSLLSVAGGAVVIGKKKEF